ncbi:MAG TPA: hypothetical protein VLE47_00510 [Candidatus Saccharimonadales bacterium]|nr:hypothetical protein [Candidatus Saccharimonadales bacterium]
MAGYSGKSLVEKLGLKEGSRVYFDNSPLSFEKEIADSPITFKIFEKPESNLDFIISFVTEKAELHETFPKLKSHLAKNGNLWVGWPKGSSKIPKDLNENIVRTIGLENSLVDVKVAAIDEDWSALKFVFRLKDR